MNTLEQLLASLADALPDDARGDAAALRCDLVQFDLPLESRIDRGVGLRASIPRCRIVTGFELPLGRVTVRYGRSA